MIGIFICLLVIALKPTPSFNYQPASIPILSHEGESVVQLSENKIAIIDTNINSGMRGQILVFEFDAKGKTFNFVGQYNYADYFRNPQNHGLPLPN
ncbi:hypothetical protein [Brevibacillus fluminis]|uniref:hypothetical protein n=1 Tax=Brevibacillus fluminis TaxID=511487 RepID=UPI0011CEB6A4|nr:hypothetical protein [Brevibacillus fluminis]